MKFDEDDLPVPDPDGVSLMWADYLVFGITLVGYIVISVVQSRVKKQSAREFLASSGQMPLFPVILSMMSTQLSAILIIGTPAEVYGGQGMIYWLYGWGMVFGCILGSLLFVPLLYPLKMVSTYKVRAKIVTDACHYFL